MAIVLGIVVKNQYTSKRQTALPDHMHMCLSIPPKFSVSMAIDYIKGKSAVRVHREFMGRKQQFTGFHFWAPSYCESTIGLDEHRNREYVKTQEQIEQNKLAQLNLSDFQ